VAPLDCPCGGARYADCCARYHAGDAAPEPEALMRSRYSAYVLAYASYLLATWHASTRPPGLDLASEAGDGQDAMRWLGLAIKRRQATGADTAIVEFVARYKIGGRAGRLHETSRFVREDGRWYYVDGNIG